MFSSVTTATPLARRRGIRANDGGRFSVKLWYYRLANDNSRFMLIIIVLAVTVRMNLRSVVFSRHFLPRMS